jgi:hypothetical protein
VLRRARLLDVLALPVLCVLLAHGHFVRSMQLSTEVGTWHTPSVKRMGVAVF